MSDIEDQGSFRASRSIPTELGDAPVSMLERTAAAAEAAAEYEGDDGMPGNQGIARVANWPDVARAALLAIREPSRAMVEAGRDTGSYAEGCNPDECWPAMIDAILDGA